MITVTTHRTADTVILRCHGRLVRGEESSLLCAAVQEHGKDVVVDLEGVTAIDATIVRSTIADNTGAYGIAVYPHTQFILDHSHSIDGLVLSGSGVLDGLMRTAQNLPPSANLMKLMNVPFEPARTPFDWLSRDTAFAQAS